MKKIIALILVISSLLCAVSALADADMQRFQPYTDVNIGMLESEGFTCTYDEMNFTAELSPKTSQLSWSLTDPDYSSIKDTYRISFDIKVVYSAGKAEFIPRLIFYRSGNNTYFDNRMSKVIIKNGENRYRVNVSGVDRSTDSKYYKATETVVEPMGVSGLIMLKDIATSSNPITIEFNSLRASKYELSSTERAAFVSFYNSCEKAGLFSQEYLLSYSDHYHIITLFNEGSEGTEENLQLEELQPTSGEDEE